MRPSTRVAINTLAQYLRTILNVCIGLYVTRVVLLALGNDDFGIYSLIAGFITMLSFITSAMSSTTQRFLSFHQTHSSLDYLKRVFSNSLFIHFLISALAFILLEIVGLFLFDGFLNIDPSRIGAAKYVYHCAVLMVIVSFLSSPFAALLIAHENLLYTSAISVADSVLKLLIALTIAYAETDRLVLYAILMLCIQIFNFISYWIYSVYKYHECRQPRLTHISKALIFEIGKFAGWSVYGTGCTIGRTQGIAIIINKMMSTAANAAFGIATQVHGAVLFVGSSLMTAMAPQIVKAEGAGNREKMLVLSTIASKLCFLLLGAVSIPLIFYMDFIMEVWLKVIPPNAVFFSQVLLISGLCDYLTYGLATANAAVGNIKKYNLIVQTIKFSTVFVIGILILFGISLKIAFLSYAVMELLSSMVRIPILKTQAGLSVSSFIKETIIRNILPVIVLSIGCYLTHSHISTITSSILSLLVFEFAYAVLIYYVSMNHRERMFLKSMLTHKIF